ncbi:MAG: hypothetical protein KDA96_26020 [Planctomycetaceae bacterium]|nr:hypothetical protein [Planctomycetaceae bacterium]
MLNPYDLLGRYRVVVTWITLISSWIVGGYLSWHGDPLRENVEWHGRRGILALELCNQPDDMDTLLKKLGATPSGRGPDQSLRDLAISDLHIDFLFIATYSTAIALVCGYSVSRRTTIFMRPVLLLAWAQFFAGFLDVIENLALLNMLNIGSVTNHVMPIVASWCATLKFKLVFAGIGVGVVASVVKWISHRAAKEAGRKE